MLFTFKITKLSNDAQRPGPGGHRLVLPESVPVDTARSQTVVGSLAVWDGVARQNHLCYVMQVSANS